LYLLPDVVLESWTVNGHLGFTDRAENVLIISPSAGLRQAMKLPSIGIVPSFDLGEFL
jgi:hypothetical protein